MPDSDIPTTWERRYYYDFEGRTYYRVENEDLSAMEINILKQIKAGGDPFGYSKKDKNNALTRLRRRGLIINLGSRAQPEWHLTSEEGVCDLEEIRAQLIRKEMTIRGNSEIQPERISMNRIRIKLEVYVDLDPIPGTFHTKESARDVVASILNQRLSHYDPMVSTT